MADIAGTGSAAAAGASASAVSSAARTVTPPLLDFSLLMMTASGPISARTVASASRMSLARKVRSCMALHLTHRAQLYAGVDFALAHHHRLRPEALDDRA